jgi:hypothetical protein
MKKKYGNVVTEVDGIPFASKKEAHRYQELKLLEKAGKISELEIQKVFCLQSGFINKRNNKLVKPILYICDFFYYDKDNDCYVVEEVKGFKSKEYMLKKKLFLKKFGDTYEFKEI